MVSRLWGDHIAGPIAAGLAIVLPLIGLRLGTSVTVTLWLAVAPLLLAVLLIWPAQYGMWKKERIATEELTERIRPKIVIQNLTPRVWPAGQAGVSVTGKEYYFDVFNTSESVPLESVRVEVTSLIPDAIGYPNPPLHVRYDESYRIEEFSVNPMRERQIDLVTGPVGIVGPLSKQVSQRELIIAHTVNKYRTPIPHGTYEITVCASAKNAKPATRKFKVWIDTNMELQCIML